MPGKIGRALASRPTFERDITTTISPEALANAPGAAQIQAPNIGAAGQIVPGTNPQELQLGRGGFVKPPPSEQQTETLQVQGAPRGLTFLADFLTGFGGGPGAAAQQQAQRRQGVERRFGVAQQQADRESALGQQNFQRSLELRRLGLQEQQVAGLQDTQQQGVDVQQQLADLRKQQLDFQKGQAGRTVNLRNIFGPELIKGIDIPDVEIPFALAGLAGQFIKTRADALLANKKLGDPRIRNVDIDSGTGIVTTVFDDGSIRQTQIATGMSMKQLLDVEKEARQFAKDALGGFVPQTSQGRGQFDAIFKAKRSELIASLTGQQVSSTADDVVPGGTRVEEAVSFAKQFARQQGAKTDADVKRRATEIINSTEALTDEQKKEAIKILNTRTLASGAGEFLNRIFGPAIQALQGKRPLVGEPTKPKKTLLRKK